MSEETNNKQSDNNLNLSEINEKLKNVESLISDEFATIKTQISEPKFKQKKDNEKYQDSDFDFLFDDEKDVEEKLYSKKELESFAKKIQETAIKVAERKTKEIIRNESEEQRRLSDMIKKDEQKAIDEFPELKNTASQFSKTVKEEIEKYTKLKPDASYNDPDLVYNAACRVYSRWAKSGLINPKEDANEFAINEAKKYANAGDYKPSGQNSSKNLTNFQKNLASRLGMEPSEVIRINEKYSRK